MVVSSLLVPGATGDKRQCVSQLNIARRDLFAIPSNHHLHTVRRVN